jgi:hypothetical protein
MNNNNIQTDMLDKEGLPLFDENGVKYDEPIIIRKRNLKCGKPKMYDEGWLAHYKNIGWYKDYNKRNLKVAVNCTLCGTKSTFIGIYQHQRTDKCKKLRETFVVIL